MATAYHALHPAEWDDSCTDCRLRTDPFTVTAEDRRRESVAQSRRVLRVIVLLLVVGGIAYLIGGPR